MNAQKVSAMTADEIAAVVRQAVREELRDAGLRVDGPEHQDEARRDFMFVRSLRNSVNGIAAKIGLAIVLSIVSGLLWLIVAGVNAWRGGS